MRTTVTLDDDVLRALRKVMRSEDKSFRQALNDALRRGLSDARPKKRRRFRVIPHSSPFCAGIDLGRLNQLVDELEAEAFVAQATSSPNHGHP